MKSCIVCSVLLFVLAVQSENIEAISERSNQESIFLKKLKQASVPSDTIVNTATWNDMLAGILVDYLKSLFVTVKKEPYEENKDTDEDKSKTQTILVKCFSKVLNLYKVWVYDKLHPRTEKPQIETEKDTEGSVDPKDDIEIVEPRYHGKLCSSENGCNTAGDTKTVIAPPTLEIKETTDRKCPEGKILNAEGNCVDAQIDRYIMWVPNHCPIGYKADRRGYCRMIW